MTVQKTVAFYPTRERYPYDFKTCSNDKGWAQVDTHQDASYYGVWINPEKRELMSFAEGDEVHTFCDTDEEFVEQVRYLAQWNTENGYWKGIDPGFNADIKARLEALGLSDLMH